MKTIVTNILSECQNVLVMPSGHIAPRTQENLELLRAYVSKKFKKNMYDRRTKASRYMRFHDSEFNRGRNG